MQQFLQGLKGTSSRIFLTSRPKASPVSDLSSWAKQVEIKGTKESVCRYIEHRIAQSPALNYLDEGLKNKVITVLTQSSEVSVGGTLVESTILCEDVTIDDSLKNVATRQKGLHK